MILNCAVPLEIKAFSGATITRLESGITNGYITKSKGKLAVTQRPSIDITESASTARGRGIYYWDANSTTYISNDDTIYKANYSTALGTTITSGKKRVHFHQLGTLLVLVDSEDNAAYTISTGDIVTTIAGSIPSTIVPGGAILNGYLFVMSETGDIWNSDLDAPGTFSAGNFINAEREEDGGVYLGKHHDHIVGFGERTIEFFYDNANPTNSPLNRREDISHNMGCANGYSIWENGDKTVFIGNDQKNGLGVYVLEQFGLKKISEEGFDSLITQALTSDGYDVSGDGVSANGHEFYLLTFHTNGTDLAPEVTYALDLDTGNWQIWETGISDADAFEVMATTIRAGTNARYLEGIMINGDIFRINNNPTPQDTIGASVYVVTDYVESGYITDTAGSGTAISMTIRMGQFDGETNKYKFSNNLKPQMSETTASQTLTISAYDNNEDASDTLGTVDTLYQEDKIMNGGRFLRRNHEISITSDEQVWIEGLELDIS